MSGIEQTSAQAARTQPHDMNGTSPGAAILLRMRTRLRRRVLETIVVFAAGALVIRAPLAPQGDPIHDATARLIAVILMLAALSHLLDRRGYDTAAAVLAVVTCLLGPWGSAMVGNYIETGDLLPLSYAVIPAMLATMLLTLRWAAVLAFSQAAMALMMPHLIASTPEVNWASLQVLVAMSSIISIVVSVVIRKGMESAASLTEALHEQNQFLNGVIESVTDPFYVLDGRSGAMLHSNSAAKGLAEHLPVHGPITVAQTFEHTFNGTDGNARHMVTQAYPIAGADPAHPRVAVYATDITDRRRIEMEKAASEKRYRSLFEMSRDALVTVSAPSWRYSSGNSAALTMFGACDEQEFTSRFLWDDSPALQPDGQASEAKARALLEAAMHDRPGIFDWTFRRRDGGEFPASVLLTRIDIDGTVSLQATIRDETEKNALHAEMAGSQRLASMGVLAAGIAHEINNPLTYVLSNLDNLAHQLPSLASDFDEAADPSQAAEDPNDGRSKQELDASQRALLDDLMVSAEEALSGTRRIGEIVRALVAFSRVERAELGPVNLREPIETALTMCQSEFKHRARVVCDFGSVPPVRASSGKLGQVFLNLLINASQAMEEGDVKRNQISIRTWSDGRQVFTEVADTGKGIAPQHLGKIFDPFFTTRAQGRGSGLGLTMCRHILMQFGGEVSVESEVGRGSRFCVRLPALDSPAVAAAPAEPRPADFRARILVIDDEPLLRRTLKGILGRQHEVVAACSGSEAQEILTQDVAFDLILCDLTMPGITGIELFDWATQRTHGLSEKFVFMTGGAITDASADFLATRVNSTLEKPFQLERLESVVSEQLAKTKPRT